MRWVAIYVGDGAFVPYAADEVMGLPIERLVQLRDDLGETRQALEAATAAS